ncbi:hypothetical protein [Staphylococcus epidermidis]|uniref:hypothetical protein n=1 Tax=Staphylococcus epidermidis TaxID=1282 RepID=UPI0016428BAB|nr:hypothetical protein [Staphylococcus epidermidis]
MANRKFNEGEEGICASAIGGLRPDGVRGREMRDGEMNEMIDEFGEGRGGGIEGGFDGVEIDGGKR